MKPKRSEPDSRGMWNIACCECKRGGNGDASCGCGMNSKRWDYKSCFLGKLLDKYEKPVISGN